MKLAPPSLLVVTNIEPTLHEAASRLDELAAARASLVSSVPSNGAVVLNEDDPRVRALGAETRARRLTFGLRPSAWVHAEDVVGQGLQGTELDVVVERQRMHVRLPLLGLFCVQAALAAAAVGLANGLDLRAVGEGLQTASSSPRIMVATGLNGTRVIDDSQNASLESDLAALNLLARLEGRKIAVLGDMLGLGPREAEGHRLVGNRAALVADDLVAVGSRARMMADEARRMGLRGAIFEAPSAEAAIDHLRRALRPGTMC